MLSPTLNNPFLDIKSDHTESLPPGDVPELHEDIARCYREAVRHARRIGQGFGIISAGDAGSGKSHLIARLRHELDHDPNAVLVTLRLRAGSLGNLWRPVRQQLFEELLRQFVFTEAGANGLLRLLRNRFPQWAAAQAQAGGLLGWLIGRSRHADLRPHLDEFARSQPLSYELLKVLPQLANPELAGIADQWLRGRQLGEDDLRALGLAPVFPSEREREELAADVVLSFLRLAGDKTTLVLCFDEVEAIQAGNTDRAVLREFATMAVTLLGMPGPRVVLTTLRFDLHTALKQAADATSMQKMAVQGTQFMKVIEWEQMLRIINARLDADPACREERLLHPPGSHWPFGLKFLEELHRTHKRILTPRHILMACGQEFTRLQTDCRTPVELVRTDPAPGEEGQGGDKPPKVSRVLRKQLEEAWEEYAGRYKKLPQSVKFDVAFSNGLPWLAHLLDLPYSRSEGGHPGIDDVNLVFFSRQKGQKSIGVSLCNDQPMSLWRRLDRIKKQWSANRGKTLGRLHLLRYADERVTATAQERLAGLRDEGVQVHLIPTQPLAELAAYQTMLAESQKGDLARPSGRPIERDEYEAWVKEHLPETHSVKELLDAVFGTTRPVDARREPAGATA